jgi:hypothetical protein
VNIVRRTSGTKWLAYFAAALLVVAGVGQAAHFCGFQSLDRRDGTVRADSFNTTLCLTCLMAQSVAAIALCIAFSSIIRRRVRVSPQRMRPRPFLESFQLYVRPPPVF